MLDYRIETFLTLYEQMNYRKTAELLNMTQPGVTQHIHHLEGFYGIKLFEYNGRQLLRTPQAEQLKRHFDSVRAKERALKEDFVQSDRIRLQIGATKTIGEFVIGSTVKSFLSREEHTLDLIVELRTGQGSSLVRDVLAVNSVESASLMAHDGEVTF